MDAYTRVDLLLEESILHCFDKYKSLIVLNMASDIMTEIKEMLDLFMEYTNDFKKHIDAKYEAKRKEYGAKILVTLQSREENCLIIQSLMKIKSHTQLKLLKHTISCFKHCIDDYLLGLSRTGHSDSDAIVISD